MTTDEGTPTKKLYPAVKQLGHGFLSLHVMTEEVRKLPPQEIQDLTQALELAVRGLLVAWKLL